MAVAGVDVEMKEEVPTYYPRSFADVQLVTRTLTRLLNDRQVPIIVNAILDAAEYWRRHTYLLPRPPFKRLPISHYGTHGTPLLKSSPVTGLQIRPVRKVVWWIDCVDQGSLTWWVASHLRARRDVDVGMRSSTGKQLERPEENWEDGPEIVRNKTVGKNFNRYRIEWAIHDDSEVSDWLRSIQVGDAIGIQPKVKSEGIVCYMISAGIEIHTAHFAI